MKNLIRIQITIVVFFFSVILFFPAVHAQTIQNLQIKQETINPGSFYYPLKRFWEATRERFMFSTEGKIKFYDSLFDVRLRELKYVSEHKILGEMERSSQRFSFQAGILNQELKKLNQTDRIQQVLKKYEEYGKLLNKLRDLYPANSAYWLLLQQNIDTLKILAELL